MKTLNILFICRANCFRSKTAEAYFKIINKNRNIKVKSAGIIPGYKQSENQVKIAKQFEINIKGKSRGITRDLLVWSDILVIVADNIPENLFDYEKNKGYIKKMIIWKVKDANSKDDRGIKNAIAEIIKETSKLNKQLNK